MFKVTKTQRGFDVVCQSPIKRPDGIFTTRTRHYASCDYRELADHIVTALNELDKAREPKKEMT